jgi:hypothetical protein
MNNKPVTVMKDTLVTMSPVDVVMTGPAYQVDICIRTTKQGAYKLYKKILGKNTVSLRVGTLVRVTKSVPASKIHCKGKLVASPFKITAAESIAISQIGTLCPNGGRRLPPSRQINPNGYVDTDGTVIDKGTIMKAKNGKYGWKEYKNLDKEVNFPNPEKKYVFHEKRLSETMRLIMREDKKTGKYQFQGIIRHPNNNANTFVRASKNLTPCVTNGGAVSKRSLGNCLQLTEAEAEEQSYWAIQAATEGETEEEAAQIISTITEEALAEEAVAEGSVAFEILEWAIALFFI